jgi:hypothetical protein
MFHLYLSWGINTFFKSFVLVWNTAILFDFDYAELENVNGRSEIDGKAVIEEDDELTEWAWPVRLFVAVITTVVGVMFVNILIGIMGQVYEEASKKRKQLSMQRKACIILDFYLLRNGIPELVMNGFRQRSGKVQPDILDSKSGSTSSSQTFGNCEFNYLWYCCVDPPSEQEKPATSKDLNSVLTEVQKLRAHKKAKEQTLSKNPETKETRELFEEICALEQSCEAKQGEAWDKIQKLKGQIEAVCQMQEPLFKQIEELKQRRKYESAAIDDSSKNG